MKIPINERLKLKTQQKFDILEIIIKIIDGIFLFIIAVISIGLIISYFDWTRAVSCPACVGCPCFFSFPPYKVYDIESYLIYKELSRIYENNVRIASWITIFLTVFAFIIIRKPLVNKLKFHAFNLIRYKYGSNEDFFKQFRTYLLKNHKYNNSNLYYSPRS